MQNYKLYICLSNRYVFFKVQLYANLWRFQNYNKWMHIIMTSKRLYQRLYLILEDLKKENM